MFTFLQKLFPTILVGFLLFGTSHITYAGGGGEPVVNLEGKMSASYIENVEEVILEEGAEAERALEEDVMEEEVSEEGALNEEASGEDISAEKKSGETGEVEKTEEIAVEEEPETTSETMSEDGAIQLFQGLYGSIVEEKSPPHILALLLVIFGALLLIRRRGKKK